MPFRQHHTLLQPALYIPKSSISPRYLALKSICGMEVIVVHKEAYNQLLAEMRKMMEAGIRTAINEALQQDKWIDAEPAKRILGIKAKSKLQQLRDDDEIIFSQHGRNIKYLRSSLDEYLERHRNK